MKLYHVSPVVYRESIERDGLDPDRCREPRGLLWFYVDEARAKAHAGWPYGSDVWELDASEELLREHSNWRTAWDAEACTIDVVVRAYRLRPWECGQCGFRCGDDGPDYCPRDGSPLIRRWTLQRAS